METPKCCCTCTHDIRTWVKDYCECHCEMDGHTIGYVETFVGCCEEWRGKGMKGSVSIDAEKTGERIWALMEKRGLSAMVVAREIIQKPQTVYRWHTGKSVPSIDNLIRLSDLFGVPIDEIIVRERK